MRAVLEPFARLVGQSAYARDGRRIGPISQVLLDGVTGRPEWVRVATGILGARQKLVPVGVGDFVPAGVRLPFEAEQVQSAPRVELRHGELSEPDEETLYRHYGMTDDSDPGLRRVGVAPAPDARWFTELARRASSPGPHA